MRGMVLIAGLMLASSAGAQEPEPVRPTERWQYAELSFQKSARAERLSIRWVTSGAKVEADTWEEMAKKLKASEPGKGDEPDHRFRALDRLGEQGWELVGLQGDVPGGGTGKGGFGGAARSVWTFKRRVRK